jgi:hypothetical protein
MGDAPNKGGREGWGGGERQRPHYTCDEHWLERMLHDLYRAVIDEPVPKQMLDTATRLPRFDPSPDAERARTLRAKAQDCLVRAERMRDESAQQALRHLARDYVKLAEHAERLIR